jgi:hypothetical protein
VYSIRGAHTFHNHIVYGYGFKEKVKKHRRLLIDLRYLTLIVQKLRDWRGCRGILDVDDLNPSFNYFLTFLTF